MRGECPNEGVHSPYMLAEVSIHNALICVEKLSGVSCYRLLRIRGPRDQQSSCPCPIKEA